MGLFLSNLTFIHSLLRMNFTFYLLILFIIIFIGVLKFMFALYLFLLVIKVVHLILFLDMM